MIQIPYIGIKFSQAFVGISVERNNIISDFFSQDRRFIFIFLKHNFKRLYKIRAK